MNKLLKTSLVLSVVSSVTNLQNVMADNLSSVLMKKWETYKVDKKEVKSMISLRERIQQHDKKMKRREVLWYKLHNVEWRVNQEIMEMVINIWDRLDNILPKWVKIKLNWRKAWLFYKYEF